MLNSIILLYSVLFCLILQIRLLEKDIKNEHESMSPQTRASYPGSGDESDCPMCAVNPALVAQLQHSCHTENKFCGIGD